MSAIIHCHPVGEPCTDGCVRQPQGIPYSVDELELASKQPMDEYHRALMQWAAQEIRRLERDVHVLPKDGK